MGKDSKKSDKKPEYWLKWKNVEKEMKKIIKKNQKSFPTIQDLRRLDYENQDIEKAIMRHGLTLDEVRLKMGYKTTESASRDKMLELLEASTESFLSNVRDIRKEREEIFQSRRQPKPAPVNEEVILEVNEPKPQFQPQATPQPLPPFQPQATPQSLPQFQPQATPQPQPQSPPQPPQLSQQQPTQVNYNEPEQEPPQEKPKNIKDKLKAFEEQLKKYEV